jgi:hypothetical protein
VGGRGDRLAGGGVEARRCAGGSAAGRSRTRGSAGGAGGRWRRSIGGNDGWRSPGARSGALGGSVPCAPLSGFATSNFGRIPVRWAMPPGVSVERRRPPGVGPPLRRGPGPAERSSGTRSPFARIGWECPTTGFIAWAVSIVIVRIHVVLDDTLRRIFSRSVGKAWALRRTGEPSSRPTPRSTSYYYVLYSASRCRASGARTNLATTGGPPRRDRMRRGVPFPLGCPARAPPLASWRMRKCSRTSAAAQLRAAPAISAPVSTGNEHGTD